MKLKIKEHPFGVFHSVSFHELDTIWNAVLEIDHSLMPLDRKSAVINTKPQLKLSMNTVATLVRTCSASRSVGSLSVLFVNHQTAS